MPGTDGETVRLVLASGSKTRLRILRDAGFAPEVMVSGVDETIDAPDTAAAVVALAERKGEVVAERCSQAVVLACDSLLEHRGVSFGKPDSGAQALEFWHRLSGQQAVLCTGHWVKDTRTNRSTSGIARTTVRFGTPDPEELAAYIDTGEPLALAGAFSIDGYAAPFIDGIDGDPSNVLGLSLPLFRTMVTEIGITMTDLWSPPP